MTYNHNKHSNMRQYKDPSKLSGVYWQEHTDLIGIIMWHLVKVKMKHKVLLLQSAQHAGEVASQAVHPAEGRHAHFTRLVAAEGEEPGWTAGNILI